MHGLGNGVDGLPKAGIVEQQVLEHRRDDGVRVRRVGVLPRVPPRELFGGALLKVRGLDAHELEHVIADSVVVEVERLVESGGMELLEVVIALEVLGMSAERLTELFEVAHENVQRVVGLPAQDRNEAVLLDASEQHVAWEGIVLLRQLLDGEGDRVRVDHERVDAERVSTDGVLRVCGIKLLAEFHRRMKDVLAILVELRNVEARHGGEVVRCIRRWSG